MALSREDTVNFFAADPELSVLHADTEAFALAVIHLLAELRAPETQARPSIVAFAAMSPDMIALHRSVRSLSETGWAFASPMLLRTELDILLGAGAIHNGGDNAAYLAFKYLFLSAKAALAGDALSDAQRAEVLGEASCFIASLPSRDHDRAQTFLSEGRLRGYWYSPEFARPAEVISVIGAPGLQELYDWLSSGSHGGFTGLSAWRDSPDDRHPDPRADRAAQNRALSFSSRFIMNFAQILRAHESAPQTELEIELLARSEASRETVEDSFRDAMRAASEHAENIRAQREELP